MVEVARHEDLIKQDINETKENQFEQLVQESYDDFVQENGTDRNLERVRYSEYFDLLWCKFGGRNYFIDILEKEKVPFLKYWTRTKKHVLATFRQPKWYSELRDGMQYEWDPLKVLIRSEEFLPYAKSFGEKWESEHIGKVEITLAY